MDILYETVLLPKPEKRKKIKNSENSSKIKDLFEKCKKGFKKPERRDSTVTSITNVTFVS